MIGNGEYYSIKLLYKNKDSTTLIHKAYNTKNLKEEFAIKIINNQKYSNNWTIDAEISACKMLQHGSIVKIIEVGGDDIETFIVMKYYPFTLLNFVNTGALSENRAKTFYKNIVDGMDYLFKQNLVHRDIKLENILLTEKLDECVLCDFEYSCKYVPGVKTLTASCGTLPYAAPELLESPALYIGPEIDIWSSGVVLFVMIECNFPFCDKNKSNNLGEIRDRINLVLSGKYKILSRRVSHKLNDIFSKIFVDSTLRISIDKLKINEWLIE
jgi:serine/threonine protein kinase